MKVWVGISNPEANAPSEVVGCYSTLPTFTRADLELPWEEFAERYVKPAFDHLMKKHFPRVTPDPSTETGDTSSSA